MSDIEILSPVGRIVWGHPGKPKPKKDNQGNVLLGDDGQPRMVSAFGLAIPEADFNNQVWPAMHQAISPVFPAGVPQNFSYKFKRHDAIDTNGRPYSEREGYPGCIVLTVSTELEVPALFKFNPATGQYDQMSHEGLKCGDHVRVKLGLKANKPTNPSHTPGLYVNPIGVEFIAYDTEIINGPDAMSMFGGQQVAIPAGASTTPVGTANVGMPTPGQQPGVPPQPGQQMQPQMQPGVPQQQPGVPPQSAPQMQPQPGMAPAVPGQQPAPQMQPGVPQQPMQQPGQLPPPANNFIPQPGVPQAAAPQPGTNYAQMHGAQPGMPQQQPGVPPGTMPPR